MKQAHSGKHTHMEKVQMYVESRMKMIQTCPTNVLKHIILKKLMS